MLGVDDGPHLLDNPPHRALRGSLRPGHTVHVVKVPLVAECEGAGLGHPDRQELGDGFVVKPTDPFGIGRSPAQCPAGMASRSRGRGPTVPRPSDAIAVLLFL